MKKYNWNKKKFFKNILLLIEILLIGFVFAYVFLGLCGVDIIL